MKKKSLLIVLIIVCCGFTSKGQVQKLDLWNLIKAVENANKPADYIVANYLSDSIIGALYIKFNHADMQKCGIELKSIEIEIDKIIDEPNLSEEQKTELDEYALLLNKYSDLKVFISIITYQNRGKRYDWGEPLDKDLRKRASCLIGEIKEYMTMKGVAKERVVVEPVPL